MQISKVISHTVDVLRAERLRFAEIYKEWKLQKEKTTFENAQKEAAKWRAKRAAALQVVLKKLVHTETNVDKKALRRLEGTHGNLG